jgi:hypothetical protein
VVKDIIYGIPFDANKLLVYNPSTDQFSSSATIPSDIDTGIYQWNGGVVVKDIIYGIPCHANVLLIYNPTTNQMSSSAKIPSDIDEGTFQWHGGVVVDDIIYGIPACANKILIYNPTTNQISSSAAIPSDIDVGDTWEDMQWVGGVVVNDIIYGIPYSANKVLINNPSTNQISFSATVPSDIDIGGRQWLGGSVVNGIIYGIPNYAKKVLSYEPALATSTSSTTSTTSESSVTTPRSITTTTSESSVTSTASRSTFLAAATTSTSSSSTTSSASPDATVTPETPHHGVGGAIGGVLGLLVLLGVAWMVRTSRKSSPSTSIGGHRRDTGARPCARAPLQRGTGGASTQVNPLYEIPSSTQAHLYDDGFALGVFKNEGRSGGVDTDADVDETNFDHDV